MKTVIEMAREAGWPDSLVAPVIMAKLAEFAELVRADERNSWPAEMEAMERQVNILTDALAQEREACAKVCDWYVDYSSNPMNFAENCAQEIRARKTP